KGKMRIINDVELYNKAEEIQVLMFGVERIKKISAKLPDKSMGDIVRGFTNKQIKKPFSNSYEGYLHAATSNNYVLREYKQNSEDVINQKIDRYVTNWGKGFEA